MSTKVLNFNLLHKCIKTRQEKEFFIFQIGLVISKGQKYILMINLTSFN